jgi:hypothetical protein
MIFLTVHVGVVYSGEYDVCDVCNDYIGFTIPTVARHIFQACPVWIYTQSNITNIILLLYIQVYTIKVYTGLHHS